MRRIALVAMALLAHGAVAHVQQQETSPRPEKAENFSPLAFEDLRAWQQAYPDTPGTLAVARAAASKYWVFRGIAYRGSMVGQGPAWASLGPLSTTEGGASGSGNFSGRVAALAISPACGLQGGGPAWVGRAGGGVWGSEDAMQTEDAGWAWVAQGLGTNR